MIPPDHIQRYRALCREVEAQAPQPGANLSYPRPGERLSNGICPYCHKVVGSKIHDLHGCIREHLSAKLWDAYCALIGSDIECPAATCKTTCRTAADFADHTSMFHADTWNRAGARCTMPLDGRGCGATFTSRAEAVSHLEGVHGFIAKKNYVKVTIEYVFHCDLDHRWLVGRHRYLEHVVGHEAAGEQPPFGGAVVTPPRDTSFHVVCPFCYSDRNLHFTERWKYWPRKRHGPHVADEHVRKLDPGTHVHCPLHTIDATCTGTDLNPSRMAQHLIDGHDLHLGNGQQRSKRGFKVLKDLSNLVSRKKESAKSKGSVPTEAASSSTPASSSSAPSETATGTSSPETPEALLVPRCSECTLLRRTGNLHAPHRCLLCRVFEDSGSRGRGLRLEESF